MNIINRSRLKAMIAGNIAVLKWLARDLVRLKGIRILSWAKYSVYLSLKLVNGQNGLRHLMDAHRFYPTQHLTRIFNKNLNLFLEQSNSLVQDVQQEALNEATSRSIILKNPVIKNGMIEKGVLLITFTESFPVYNKYIDCEQLLKYFSIVLEPSWAGYCNPNILFWMKYQSHRIVIQSTEQMDYSFITSLKSNLIPVDFGASDWVDYRIFHPINGSSKKYDAIYVCTYKPIKRHHVLFKAIHQIRDPTYKVALVCVSWGGTRSEIEKLIDHYKIRNNITLYEDCPPSKVNELLNMSKVNVLLSIKEGSNRSIFEGLFSNIPCIVLRNNVGVNKSYINSMTGELIVENRLAETLLHFKRNWDQYRPCDWALRNIAPPVTTRKLSTCLQEIANDNHEPWSCDIVPKVNAPEVKYFYPSDNQHYPDSRSVISLFLKSNTKEPKSLQIIRDSLIQMCASVDVKGTHDKDSVPSIPKEARHGADAIQENYSEIPKQRHRIAGA